MASAKNDSIKTLSSLYRAVIAIGIMVAGSVAVAQTPPDAGSIQRQVQRDIQQTLKNEPTLKTPTVPQEKKTQEGKSVRVQKFVFSGNTLISDSELALQLQDLVGKSLTLPELNAAARKITDYYREQGWFVDAYVPQQTVNNGVIRIQVVEGHYGGSEIDNESSRINANYVGKIITGRLRPGEPLSAKKLERGVLLANDLPGIQANAILFAGKNEGETNVRIKLDDEPLFNADLGVNNFGAKSTGRYQAVGGISLDDLTGYGDQLVVRALIAQRLGNIQLNYSFPVGHDGWRLAAHASALGYELGRAYSDLDAEGEAYTFGVNASYPIIRQSGKNLSVTMGLERRRYDDDMLGFAIRRHRINAMNLGLSGSYRDSWGGGGVTWGGIHATYGELRMHEASGDRVADAAGPKTRGTYAKLGFRLARLQAVGNSNWQVFASLRGQMAGSNLPSSEQFSLGGPGGVRAYPGSEATGDEGLLLSLELRRNFTHGFQGFVFYDFGYIHLHEDTWKGWNRGTDQRNNYTLSGAGLGINWNYKRLSASGSVAIPIGDNPGAFNGRNNDGSNASSPSYWMTLAIDF